MCSLIICMACSTLHFVHTNNIVFDVSIFLQVLLLSHSLVIALILVCPGEHLRYVTNHITITILQVCQRGGVGTLLIVFTYTTKEYPYHACLGRLDPPQRK